MIPTKIAVIKPAERGGNKKKKKRAHGVCVD